jgi:hypothetical protein
VAVRVSLEASPQRLEEISVRLGSEALLRLVLWQGSPILPDLPAIALFEDGARPPRRK